MNWEQKVTVKKPASEPTTTRPSGTAKSTPPPSSCGSDEDDEDLSIEALKLKEKDPDKQMTKEELRRLRRCAKTLQKLPKLCLRTNKQTVLRVYPRRHLLYRRPSVRSELANNMEFYHASKIIIVHACGILTTSVFFSDLLFSGHAPVVLLSCTVPRGG